MKPIKLQESYFFLILISTLLLNACASTTTETQVQFIAETPTKVIIATSTPTEIPTQTKEAIIEKRYTSCMDSELMTELDINFVEATGETVPERMARVIAEGKIKEQTIIHSKNRLLIADMLFVGHTVISLEDLPGSQVGDKALCFYFSGYEHPENKIPVIISFIRDGEYYPVTLGLFDGRNGTGSKATWVSDHESMDQAMNWLAAPNGPNVGDIFNMQIFTFKDINNFDDLKNAEEGAYARKANIALLLQALNNDYLARIDGGGYLSLFEELNSGKGDIGAFAQNVYWIEDMGDAK